MPRLADLNNKFTKARWDGVDEDILGFRNELYTKFPDLVVTSAMRYGNGVGKLGNKSRHNRGQAMDLGYHPEVQKFLYSREGDALLRKYNLGFLDESIEDNLKATGGTGKHFHIGKDSTLAGNSHKKNIAFKAISSLESLEMGEQATPLKPEGDPNNSNLIEYQANNPQDNKFYEETLKQWMAERDQAEAEYLQKKAATDRQNAIQEHLQRKYTEQISILEAVKSNELGFVPSRNKVMEMGGEIPKFKSGGQFLGLDDNVQFKIDMLKSTMPDFSRESVEDSPEYMRYVQANDMVDRLLSNPPKNQVTYGVNNHTGNTNSDTLEDVKEGSTPTETTSSATPHINKILSTIRQRESTNDYGRISKSSSASGAYQFIDSTWQGLTKEFNIGTQYAKAYQAPKEIQDKVAEAYVSKILSENNNDLSKVPITWYTGNSQGRISQAAIKANNGLTPARYAANWMKTYNNI